MGGLTTFSGFAIEIVRYFEVGQITSGLFYFLGQNVLATVACLAGYFLVKSL